MTYRYTIVSIAIFLLSLLAPARAVTIHIDTATGAWDFSMDTDAPLILEEYYVIWAFGGSAHWVGDFDFTADETSGSGWLGFDVVESNGRVEGLQMEFYLFDNNVHELTNLVITPTSEIEYAEDIRPGQTAVIEADNPANEAATVHTVPEPATAGLLAAGLLGGLLLRRRRASSAPDKR